MDDADAWFVELAKNIVESKKCGSLRNKKAEQIKKKQDLLKWDSKEVFYSKMRLPVSDT